MEDKTESAEKNILEAIAMATTYRENAMKMVELHNITLDNLRELLRQTVATKEQSQHDETN